MGLQTRTIDTIVETLCWTADDLEEAKYMAQSALNSLGMLSEQDFNEFKANAERWMGEAK